MTDQTPFGAPGYGPPGYGPPGYGTPQPPPGQPGYGYGYGHGPGYGQPYDAPPPGHGHGPGAGPGGGPVLLALGDIAVIDDKVMTPGGALPLKGAVWTATDLSRTDERIPPHAIVLAVVFFLFCLLGLLFLLMKEKVTIGFVQVAVSSGGRYHTTMVPVDSPQGVALVMGHVNYARSLSM
ncbi:hypothetical protein LHJ74_32160 [Streptomyces sp. N2-109]|uniref:Uncharacterized protein n=1 Tax=Streptomyces gossypii TaxID=2883101 RepID=A0ABT2K2W2_9ACTN|nr:hypothetical protein [Streptomyces gossypii]MCT2594510.1 hypothetical protein [Streptomyces gossypii]